jgi:hypothetical protein
MKPLPDTPMRKHSGEKENPVEAKVELLAKH